MNKVIKPIIAKFGGTSVSSAKRIETICDIVQKEILQHPVIVVSALSGVTDLLLSLRKNGALETDLKKLRTMHRKLIFTLWKDKNARKEACNYIEFILQEIGNIAKKHATKANTDALISHGEIMSSYIITCALTTKGIPARQIIASDIIVTDKQHGAAEFIIEPTKQKVRNVLVPIIEQNTVPVVTGFIGKSKHGKVTTLGRGGSDYTASILGYCLQAKEIQIWTDVDGIYTTDPRLVKKAKLLREISYREASEMAFFGAKVLHPRTLRPAIKAKIPLRVLNTFRPDSPGTRILDRPRTSFPISAITFKRNVTLVNIYSTAMLLTKGFLVSLFNIFAKHNISIDLVSVSEVSVSVTLDNDNNLDKAIRELGEFTSVTVSKHFSTLSLIGEDITGSSGVIRNIFTLLDKKHILVKMISLGATNINISFVVDAAQLENAVKILHNRLLLRKMVQ